MNKQIPDHTPYTTIPYSKDNWRHVRLSQAFAKPTIPEVLSEIKQLVAVENDLPDGELDQLTKTVFDIVSQNTLLLNLLAALRPATVAWPTIELAPDKTRWELVKPPKPEFKITMPDIGDKK